VAVIDFCLELSKFLDIFEEKDPFLCAIVVCVKEDYFLIISFSLAFSFAEYSKIKTRTKQRTKKGWISFAEKKGLKKALCIYTTVRQ